APGIDAEDRHPSPVLQERGYRREGRDEDRRGLEPECDQVRVKGDEEKDGEDADMVYSAERLSERGPDLIHEDRQDGTSSQGDESAQAAEADEETCRLLGSGADDDPGDDDVGGEQNQKKERAPQTKVHRLRDTPADKKIGGRP